MFEEFQAPQEGVTPAGGEALVFSFPPAAVESAPRDGDGEPRPEWAVDQYGRAHVSAAATRPAEAWEDAAEYLQGVIDSTEVVFRRAELARVDAIRHACAGSMKDLEFRYGLADSQIVQQGMRAFAQQTALSMGTTSTRVLHMIDTASRAERLLPATWAVYRDLDCSWRALEAAIDETDGLPAEVLAAFDAAAAKLVVSVPMTRLAFKLRKERERLQDDTAAARAKTTLEKRTVRLRIGRDGATSLTLTGPAATLVALGTALTKAAIASKTDDETRTVGQLRH